MADILTKIQRSRCMASIKAVDTKPEITVRKIVHDLGYRFRLHSRYLPGRPDLVLSRHHVVIFVHGCFWHQHKCSDGHIPNSRTDYWGPKLFGNRARDQGNRRRLRKLGWRVLTVWECQTTDYTKLRMKISCFLHGHHK